MTTLSPACNIPQSVSLLGLALLCEPGDLRCHFFNEFGEKKPKLRTQILIKLYFSARAIDIFW